MCAIDSIIFDAISRSINGNKKKVSNGASSMLSMLSLAATHIR